MAQTRKDLRGRVLRKGESQRRSDERYVYTYTDPLGRRKYVYAQDLVTLREKEAQLMKDQMDQQLMSSDKYYSKTKTRKEAELAGVESQAYRNYTALMEGIEAIRRDYGQISKKYRESMLPFLINDLHFLFSAQRKKDYESLIVLRNTVHKFVNEVSELLPEIMVAFIRIFMNIYV